MTSRFDARQLGNAPPHKRSRTVQHASRRAQQDSQLYNLMLDINELKQELHDLAFQRELIRNRSTYSISHLSSTILSTVAGYFRGFERGYRGVFDQPEQHAFVRSIADESLSLGVTGLGVDMLLEQWRRYTDIFHIRQTVLCSTEVITGVDESPFGALVKCAVEFRGVLTRRAVDIVFPNALREPLLMLRAVGRGIRIPMLFHLFFNEDGKLVRHDAEADFLCAVQEALNGDVNAAACFIEQAQVGQESMLGPL